MSHRPVIVVCEDGHEYSERFTRLLGGEARFIRAPDLAAARSAIDAGADGLFLDLDFRRAPPATLVDESSVAQAGRSDGESRRLAQIQGILVLRALRQAGVTLPALLFADLDDPARQDYLEQSLAPLEVIPSSVGLPAIAERIRAWTAS